MSGRVIEWSMLTADCADRDKAPHGPVRLIVRADRDALFCTIMEAKMTSYADTAQPYADGTLGRVDLPISELEWLEGILRDAKNVLRFAEREQELRQLQISKPYLQLCKRCWEIFGHEDDDPCPCTLGGPHMAALLDGQ